MNNIDHAYQMFLAAARVSAETEYLEWLSREGRQGCVVTDVVFSAPAYTQYRPEHGEVVDLTQDLPGEVDIDDDQEDDSAWRGIPASGRPC